jgi:hypothetical protein
MTTIQKVKKSLALIFRIPVKAPDTYVFVDEHFLAATDELEENKKVRAEQVKRLLKLRRYYKYFSIRKRYKIKFKEFRRRVDTNQWIAWLSGD